MVFIDFLPIFFSLGFGNILIWFFYIPLGTSLLILMVALAFQSETLHPPSCIWHEEHVG